MMDVSAEKCMSKAYLCAEKCIFVAELSAEKCRSKAYLCAEKCIDAYGKTCVTEV